MGGQYDNGSERNRHQYEGWGDSAQDRDYWRALVNAESNLRFHKPWHQLRFFTIIPFQQMNLLLLYIVVQNQGGKNNTTTLFVLTLRQNFLRNIIRIDIIFFLIESVTYSSKGATPVNQTSTTDWQMAARRDNVISITLRQV